MAEGIASVFTVIPDVLQVGGKMIEWAIATFPVNLALVAMVAGTATGLIKKARRDLIGK